MVEILFLLGTETNISVTGKDGDGEKNFFNKRFDSEKKLKKLNVI